MIDFALLEKLLDLLHRSEAQTIEIRKGFWTTTVKISKNASHGGPVTYQLGAPASSASPASSARPLRAGEAEEAGEAGAAASSTTTALVDIKSPMVGTFYAQPEPGADPYVRVGSRITPGQTLCIIEAMKIMNPLDSEVSGVVREVAIDDAQPVEFGQVLFRVDPHG